MQICPYFSYKITPGHLFTTQQINKLKNPDTLQRLPNFTRSENLIFTVQLNFCTLL